MNSPLRAVEAPDTQQEASAAVPKQDMFAASSVAVVDRNAPFMRWAEKLVKRLTTEVDAAEQHYFALPAYCDDTDEEKDTYPFPELLWTPLTDGEKVVGGFLSTREDPLGRIRSHYR